MSMFNDIHGVEDLIIAVGDNSRIEICTDGRLWRRHRPPIPSADLTRVRVLSRSLAYITGPRGLILRFNGKDFHPLPSPTHRNLFSVWAPAQQAASVPPEVWFGGADVLLCLRGDSFVSYPLDHWVTAIWGLPQAEPFADVWFIGPTRRCLRWDGVELYPYPITPPDTRAAECLLHGISGPGTGEIWLAGSQGLIMRHGPGGRWERVPSGTGDALYGICHDPVSGEAWVATGRGQVRRYLGDGLWSIQADISALGGGIEGLCIVGGTVWFCGRKGIFHYLPLPSPMSKANNTVPSAQEGHRDDDAGLHSEGTVQDVDGRTAQGPVN